MSAWVISLTERLLKQCVMSSDLSSKDLEEQSPSSFAPPLDVPVLLHIGHPFALDNFIVALSHVQKFCAYIKSLAPRGESAQIARDIVVDLIGNSGIELSDLINSLEHTRQELMGLEPVEEH
ncbi:hypothetical protein DXG01_017146 [Tephrocybe rancida]|nr:hypothetical protein DXG01_017146 [Tephrocybe rancida]